MCSIEASGSSCVPSIGSTIPTLVGFVVVELKAELFYVMHVCEVSAMMPIAEMNETIYHNVFSLELSTMPSVPKLCKNKASS
jgi:hypothetical protein